MDPSMEDLVLIARKIGETAGIPNHVERARQVRAVVLELEEAQHEAEVDPADVAYQIVGALAHYTRTFNHPDVQRALDYLSGEKVEDILPWPREAIVPAAAAPENKEGGDDGKDQLSRYWVASTADPVLRPVYVGVDLAGAPVTSPAPLKIEEGKFYRMRYGRKMGPMRPNEDPEYPWTCEGFTFTDDGFFWKSEGPSPDDLIAEWTDEPVASQAPALNPKD